jgi:hypothetical protein
VPLETRKSNTSNKHETRIANGNSVKQIVIGQRAFESSKWKLEDGYIVSALAVFQRKRGLVSICMSSLRTSMAKGKIQG